MAEPILKIQDLRVVYTTDESTVYAVNGVNLELFSGETLGLIGETGAGKTTTALSIMGLLPEKIGKVTGGSRYAPAPGQHSINDLSGSYDEPQPDHHRRRSDR